MRADPLRGQVGSGWALEIVTVLGHVKCHRSVRRVPFGFRWINKISLPVNNYSEIRNIDYMNRRRMRRNPDATRLRTAGRYPDSPTSTLRMRRVGRGRGTGTASSTSRSAGSTTWRSTWSVKLCALLPSSALKNSRKGWKMTWLLSLCKGLIWTEKIINLFDSVVYHLRFHVVTKLNFYRTSFIETLFNLLLYNPKK